MRHAFEERSIPWFRMSHRMWFCNVLVLGFRNSHIAMNKIQGNPIVPGWWLGSFFVFPYIGNNSPNWNYTNLSSLNLVGGLEPWNFMNFHTLGIIIPTDFHIFQRGRSTTNQLFIAIWCYLSSGIRKIAPWSGRLVSHRIRTVKLNPDEP